MRRLNLYQLLFCGLLISASPKAFAAPDFVPQAISGIDRDLVDDISRRSFRYFLENTNERTGLVLDRALTNGEDKDRPAGQGVASIAATGFGLSAYCVAADHRWISRQMARQRILAALNFFADEAFENHGWFYHFVDASTGRRAWRSEISSIDTALLLAGVLTARGYFEDDPEIVSLATKIYERVDFPWMMNGSHTFFSHGWTPEAGFLRYRWDTYSEHMILYVLAIGSRTHPIPADSWNHWKLPVVNVGGYTYVGGGPLFIHQYSQAWLDLRDRGAQQNDTIQSVGPKVDYFANSIAATRAQQSIFSRDLARQFPGYSENVWGVTASDSSHGYTDWGGVLPNPRVDGSVAPSAAAGSLMFVPELCLPALRTMLVQYGKQVYGRYGFADAFNPTTGWVSKYVIGIDVGITLLSAENLRTGNLWQWFMRNPEPNSALEKVGLASRRAVTETSVYKTRIRSGREDGKAADAVSRGISQ